jgi:dihydrofolate reductase
MHIDWAAPDEELMRFHNEQTRELTGHLTGRRLYENMLVWETAEQTWPDPRALEFARLWKAIPKVVFSSSLTKVEGNARLARRDVADEAAEVTSRPGTGIVCVGGAQLAASLAAKDLIDEYRLFVSPVVLGGGTPYFPPLPERLDLELIETQTFTRAVYLRYRRS